MRHHHHACSRAHQVGALLLVAATFLLTRLFDRLLLDTSSSSTAVPSSFAVADAALRIYVYAEDEIHGLRALLRGRDGTVPVATCLKGQWATQLESPELKLSGPDKLGRIDYFKHLRNAKFCLAPRGESSWTLRFYESFFVECVPVILSDEVELPFQNVIDYREISIKWPSSRIGPELLGYLESIPDERIEEMIDRGREMRCLWVYAADTELCSAMSGILWELQRKVRQFHQSPETFWLHNRSIVNRDLDEFHRWRRPVPLP